MKIIDNSECLKDFGKYIRDKRESKGILQSEMAKQLKITQAYYSMIERGERNLDLIVAINICNILGLNLQTFIKRYL